MRHAIALVEMLQCLPAARLLPSVVADGETLRNDLQGLEKKLTKARSTASKDVDLGPFERLLEAVLLNKSDDCIWSQAYDIVRTTQVYLLSFPVGPSS
jgi:hypothetical protein